ncbi:hypothetical protein TcWFU_003507 [Taenia crassiceps]|uniref:Uncharacterized protein n=1 Tax=Taenia crassiceps TaxID=6207 RepID=A0ABR4Q5Q0_9CEST
MICSMRCPFPLLSFLHASYLHSRLRTQHCLDVLASFLQRRGLELSLASESTQPPTMEDEMLVKQASLRMVHDDDVAVRIVGGKGVVKGWRLSSTSPSHANHCFGTHRCLEVFVEQLSVGQQWSGECAVPTVANRATSSCSMQCYLQQFAWGHHWRFDPPKLCSMIHCSKVEHKVMSINAGQALWYFEEHMVYQVCNTNAGQAFEEVSYLKAATRGLRGEEESAAAAADDDDDEEVFL